MIYELWDIETANVVVSYETEAEALAAVRKAVARHGESYVEGLALIREDDRGESQTMAEGRSLLNYAVAEALLPLPAR